VTWIKANVNASGYYRVNYEPAIWTSLIRVLTTQPTAFSPADRAQLIDDAFTLAWYLILFNFLSSFKTEVLIELLIVMFLFLLLRAGVLNITVPLTLSQYLVNETEYLPWATALTHLRKLDTLLSIRTARMSLHCFVRHLVTPLYSILGWTTKVPHIQRYSA